MAKEKEKPAAEGKSESAGKKRKLHLHEIRTTAAHDGSYTHHHSYKENKDAPFTMPERGPMATSASPEEAGQHVQEQFAMNQGGGGGQEPEGGGELEAGAGGGAMQPGA